MFAPDIDMTIMFEPEELCDELKRCEGMSSGGRFRGIWHPLVVSVPHHDPLNRMVNMQLRAKRAKAEAAWSKRDWATYIAIHERPFRIEALQRVCNEETDTTVCWGLIADFWTDSENIWQCFDQWRELWNTPGHSHELIMSEAELKRFKAMPHEIKVYRGTRHEESAEGMSWTVSRKKAVWFANRYRSEGQGAFLAEGVVRKDDVLAYFEGRGESEIVAFPEVVNVTSVKGL